MLFSRALIGTGFLWSGTAYIVQAYRLLQFLDGDGKSTGLWVYYVCQAVGIGAFALLSAKYPAIAGGRALPFYTSIAMVVCTGIAMFSPDAGVVIAAGTLLNLMIGGLSACYLTRLSTDVPQQRRGLVFGIAYAFGSVGTWFLSLPMNGKFLWNRESFFGITILATVSLLFVRHLSPLPEQIRENRSTNAVFNKKQFGLPQR